MAYIKNPIQAISYSKFRPSPPAELILKIVAFVKEEISMASLGTALDVGCGSGQSTEVLAPYFQQVIGIDSSKEQLKHAQDRVGKPKNVLYREGSAEGLEEADGSVDLVTAGMAAHWFDLQRFSVEVERVLRPNGVLALYGYSLPCPAVNGVSLAKSFHSMINSSLGSYFPEGSKHAYFDGYKNSKFYAFPFAQNLANRYEFSSRRTAFLRDLIGYITTMSGFQNYLKTHGEENAQNLLSQFRNSVAEHIDGIKHDSIEEVKVEITFLYYLLLSRKNKY